jgi:TonB family protein
MVLGLVMALAMQAVSPAQDAVAPDGISKPEPRGRPQAWLTDDDYPAGALSRREFGTVKFRTGVDEKGNVTDCHVIGSSGYSDLDDMVCKLLHKRAEFRPARDSAGKDIAYFYQGSFHWNFPGRPGLHNPVSDIATAPMALLVELKAVPKSYANPALLRLVFAAGKMKACTVEASTGNPRLDAIACEQASGQISPLKIEGARIAQPNSRMVEARFEVAK